MIRIITDSVASIPAEIAKDRNIEVVSLFVRHDGVEYEDATMDLDDFYSRIDQMVDDLPTSSQPSQLTLETLLRTRLRPAMMFSACSSPRACREPTKAPSAQLARSGAALLLFLHARRLHVQQLR